MGKDIESARERERERKKREEARWKKILAWYMMEQMEQQKQLAEARQDGMLPFYAFPEQTAGGTGLSGLFFQHEEGEPSLFEMLLAIDALEEPEPGEEAEEKKENPFRSVLNALREEPVEEQKLDSALNRCVEEAPQRILDRERKISLREQNRKDPPDPEHAARRRREERRFHDEMVFLRRVMPPELFRSFCAELMKQGRSNDPERDFLTLSQESLKAIGYGGKENAPQKEKEGENSPLREVQEAMNNAPPGKTAAFHKMRGALNRYIEAGEPGGKQKDALLKTLADYAVTEGSPRHPEYSETGFQQAVCGVKALTSEEDFAKFLTAVNRSRAKDAQVMATDFAKVRQFDQPQAEIEAPERVLRPDTGDDRH